MRAPTYMGQFHLLAQAGGTQFTKRINYSLTEIANVPYMVRERCRQRHCRMTRPQVRSGDWGRKIRWLRPLLWNPPPSLKAPGGSWAHTPDETELSLSIFSSQPVAHFDFNFDLLTFSSRTETQFFTLLSKVHVIGTAAWWQHQMFYLVW